MAAYRRVWVDDLRSPADWLPVHWDQLRAQRSVSSMGSLYLYLTFTFYQCKMQRCRDADVATSKLWCKCVGVTQVLLLLQTLILTMTRLTLTLTLLALQYPTPTLSAAHILQFPQCHTRIPVSMHACILPNACIPPYLHLPILSVAKVYSLQGGYTHELLTALHMMQYGKCILIS